MRPLARLGLASGAVLLCTSCLQSQTQLCASGLICPPATACAEVGGATVCVVPSQIDACRTAADGDPCTYAGADGICTDGICLSASCGDGKVRAPEECDGQELAGATCEALGFYPGVLACTRYCLVDIEGCGGRCGDGQINGGEFCDDGNRAPGDGCSDDCMSDEVCGNGILDVTETCDDGNAVSGDGCNSTCRSTEQCGNGWLDTGEECDDGNLTVEDGCSEICRFERCGDGVLSTVRGELCDDGNNVGDDGCSPDCQSDESCGNGHVDEAVREQCDDGNVTAGDGCSVYCTIEDDYRCDGAPSVCNNDVAYALWPMPDSPTAYCVSGAGEVPCPSSIYPGQDGNYRINVPTYTRTPPYLASDSVTGLMWGYFTSSVNTQNNWSLCSGVCSKGVLEGFSDWRCPTGIERLSAADYGHFYGGSVLIYGPSNTFCVRSTLPPPSGPHYTTAADATTDNWTRLTWQNNPPTTTYTWPQALAYCEGLSLAGYSDWRLPSVKEMPTRPAGFVAGWSSTPAVATGQVYQYTQYTPFLQADPTTLVRAACVRGG